MLEDIDLVDHIIGIENDFPRQESLSREPGQGGLHRRDWRSESNNLTRIFGLQISFVELQTICVDGLCIQYYYYYCFYIDQIEIIEYSNWPKHSLTAICPNIKK